MSDLFDEIVSTFKSDPRTKVFASEELLIESVQEETNKKISTSQLRSIIYKYISGDMADKDEVVYDGAVAICGALARNCFSEDPEEDIDYEIDWLEQDDGSYIAEIRPN